MQECLTFADVGLIPAFNSILSRSHVDIRTMGYDHPFVPANMDTVISKEMIQELNKQNSCLIFHRFCPLTTKLELAQKYPNLFLSCGVSNSERDHLDILLQHHNKFCIDIAHSHSQIVADLIQYMRSKREDLIIIAGNVCTADGYRFLAEAGANIIKVGIGGGAPCSTRIMTGFGVPQFSALQTCGAEKQILKQHGIITHMIADGGIQNPRDAVLAIAVGADLVMMGSLFAKTLESAGKKYTLQNGIFIPTDTTTDKEEIYTHYRGQASKHFMDEYYNNNNTKTAEGVDYYTKVSGTVKELVDTFSGGLRSAMTYNGSQNLQEFQYNVKLFRSTPAYMDESHPKSK